MNYIPVNGTSLCGTGGGTSSSNVSEENKYYCT